ncbi:MAG TPA: glutamate--tRNA ligase, partial [Polyangia bacterium]
HEYLAARGIGLGDIVHAVRVAVTGAAIGPGLFDCLEIVGRQVSVRRIDRALERARAPRP